MGCSKSMWAIPDQKKEGQVKIRMVLVLVLSSLVTSGSFASDDTGRKGALHLAIGFGAGQVATGSGGWISAPWEKEEQVRLSYSADYMQPIGRNGMGIGISAIHWEFDLYGGLERQGETSVLACLYTPLGGKRNSYCSFGVGSGIMGTRFAFPIGKNKKAFWYFEDYWVTNPPLGGADNFGGLGVGFTL